MTIYSKIVKIVALAALKGFVHIFYCEMTNLE